VTISSGQNAVFPLLLTSAANVSGTVTFTCGGIPANANCNVTPASVALGSTSTIAVTVLTGVTNTSSLVDRLLKKDPVLWLTTLLPLSLMGLRRHRLPRLAAGALLCMLIAASGCGAGREIPLEGGPGSGPPTGPATPAGTYIVAASASCAGFTRSISLTLIIQ
jgi:hypothetical protein